MLLWPASRVSDWLKRIDLGDYTGHLEGSGLHGALMVSHTLTINTTHPHPVQVLEVTFTEESLARLLGIPPGKVFLRKHLLRRFLDIVGPVVAQSKIDAQQVKNFTALDPIGKSKADRVRPLILSIRTHTNTGYYSVHRKSYATRKILPVGMTRLCVHLTWGSLNK